MENLVLTPEERAEFEAFKAEKAVKEKAAKLQDDRSAYKEMKDTVIGANFELLKGVSEFMLQAKKTVFGNTEDLIQMKDELYNTKSNRKSNSFTSEDGKVTLKLGYRVNEGWADEVEAGVSKVQDYLRTLAIDNNSADLVDTVMRLLKTDRKGNLKANKILELEQLANKSGNSDFLDGINIIKEAYRPSPSCQFIEVRFKDDNGKEHALPLSMSAIENY